MLGTICLINNKLVCFLFFFCFSVGMDKQMKSLVLKSMGEWFDLALYLMNSVMFFKSLWDDEYDRAMIFGLTLVMLIIWDLKKAIKNFTVTVVHKCECGDDFDPDDDGEPLPVPEKKAS